MSLVRLFALIVLSSLISTATHAGGFADSVVAYVPGNGVTSDYSNPASALGEPARVTPGVFGGPVDPFAPAYLGTQVVSLGDGGALTVRFSNPIANEPVHPFGLDFLVYGNAGFVVTNALDENWSFIGTPATDGTLFGHNEGATRVWVSMDNVTYYLLDPTRAPNVDVLFPTDGQGDFQLPAAPGLTAGDFGGLTLEDLRTLYGGAGGGAGFDLAWALDDQGQSVALERAEYVRVEVLSGKADIDAFVSVPEPTVWALAGLGVGGWVWFRRRTVRP